MGGRDYANPAARAEAARIAAAAVRPLDPDLADRIERSRLTRDGIAEAFGPLRRGGDRNRREVAASRRALLHEIYLRLFYGVSARFAAREINMEVSRYRKDGRWDKHKLGSGCIDFCCAA